MDSKEVVNSSRNNDEKCEKFARKMREVCEKSHLNTW